MEFSAVRCPSRLPSFLLSILLLLTAAHASLSIEERKRRHPEIFDFPYIGRGDPDHSFMHPYNPSPGGDPINGWFQLGSTTVARSNSGRDVVRITSAAQANQGILYNAVRTATNNFNGYIDVQMDTSSESHEPADGMGFFFVKDRPVLGSAMGITHTYQGLGIIIDTFSNSRTRRVPYVYAYVSDGTKEWNPDSDGADMEITRGCQLEMNTHIRLYIQFVDGDLHVGVAMNARELHRWHTCFKAQNIRLPFSDGGFLTFAAETGHFFAMHEVHDAAFADESAFGGEGYRSDYQPQDYGEPHHNPEVQHQEAQHQESQHQESHGDAVKEKKKIGMQEERSDPQKRVHMAGTAAESLSGSLDLQVFDMFNEFSSAMKDVHGKEAEEAKLRLTGIRDVTGHLIREMEKQKSEMATVLSTLTNLKKTSGELSYESDKFTAQLGTLHKSLTSLNDRSEETLDNHAEMHDDLMSHHERMGKEKGGSGVVVLFMVVQLLIVTILVGVVRMSSAPKKLGRMV